MDGRAADGRSPDGRAAPDGSPTDVAPAPRGSPLDGAGPLEKLGGGYGFVEGPVWLADRGELLFCDADSGVHRYVPASAAFSPVRRPAGGPNGLALDPQGRILTCEFYAQQLTRSRPDGTGVEVLAMAHEGRRLDTPNDVIVRRDGTVLFTEYALGAGGHDGLFRLTPTGQLVSLSEMTGGPNGIALSPDEAFLYVTYTRRQAVYRFRLTAEGGIAAGEELARTGAIPDGIAVDDQGNLYVTTLGPRRVEVRRPDGSLLGTIAVPEEPRNCAFGGPDRRTLFITAGTSLYQIRLAVPGPP